MELTQRKILLLSIAAIFLISGCLTEKRDNSITLSLPKETFREGEEITVAAEAQEGIYESLLLSLGAVQKSELCPAKGICRVELKTSLPQGAYMVKAIGISDELKVEESKRLNVLSSGKKCVNGVAAGTCSEEKPKYCNGTILIDNCSKCGCEKGFECSLTECIPSDKNISIESILFEKLVKAGSEIEIIGNIVPLEEGSAKSYLAELIINGEAYEKTFSIGSEPVTVAFRGISLGKGVFDLNFIIKSAKDGAILNEKYVENAITSVSTAEVPEAPVITSIFAEGDDVVLEWNPVESAAKYRIYLSKEENSAFISYEFWGETDSDTTTKVIQGLDAGKKYFLVTAVNVIGQESEYSEVKSVIIGSA